MTTKDFKLNKEFSYTDIENFVCNNEEFELVEHGENLVGLNFVVIKGVETDDCISFVLTGMSSEYIYKCIYSDY